MCTERAGDGQEEDLKTETSRLSIPIVVLSSYNNSIICNRRTVGKQRRLCQVPKGRREPASSVQADKEEQSQIKIFLGSGKGGPVAKIPQDRTSCENSRKVVCIHDVEVDLNGERWPVIGAHLHRIAALTSR